MPLVVIAVFARQPDATLSRHLAALSRLDRAGCELAYVLSDDNRNAEASALLRRFAASRDAEILAPAEGSPQPDGETLCTPNATACDDAIMDMMLVRALNRHADAVLFVDADLVLHPLTLRVLLEADVEIVGETFWMPGPEMASEVPSVREDHSTPLPSGRHAELAELAEPAGRCSPGFIDRLKMPGLHRVGSVRGCMLVRRAALEAGVRFSAPGDLRRSDGRDVFCVEAALRGIPLFADTHVPPLKLGDPPDPQRLVLFEHEAALQTRRWELLQAARAEATTVCMRDPAALLELLPPATASTLAAIAERTPDLSLRARANAVRSLPQSVDGVRRVDVEVDFDTPADPTWSGRLTVRVRIEEPAESGEVPSSTPRWGRPPRILLSMIVHNEADRYLARVIDRALGLVDDVLIVDDASEDGTVDLCLDLLRTRPHRIERLATSRFGNEHELRALQWRAALERRPDWVLVLDADELLECDAVRRLPDLLAHARENVIAMRLFDMWDDNHYRDDELWTAHRRHWPVLARAEASASFTWNRTAQHCGRLPRELLNCAWACTDLRIQHLGWMRPEDREAKYERYLRFDPAGAFGNALQYRSILDAAPALTLWRE